MDALQYSSSMLKHHDIDVIISHNMINQNIVNKRRHHKSHQNNVNKPIAIAL
jgi:hypothetical protein